MISYSTPPRFRRFHLTISLKSSSLPLRPVSQSFLTCYHNPVLSYDFYFTPFQLEAWIAFLVFTFFMCAFLRYLIVQQFGREIFARFSALMFVLSTITDDSCGMPQQLRRNWKIRFLFGPWFLTSVVLVNCYIGLAISSLTAPFQLTSIHFFQNLTDMHYSHNEIVRDKLWLKALLYYRGQLSYSGMNDFTIQRLSRKVARGRIFQPWRTRWVGMH